MEKFEVYHAGTECILKPDCDKGRINLDFGKGFYLTDIYDQAVMWAERKSRERRQEAVINVYRLDKSVIIREGRIKVFNSYDDDWLDFIVACRNGYDVRAKYDYIEGGVANDRVINTVNLYMQGYISKDRALDNLRYIKPNNQICISNQKLLDKCLEYIECLKVPRNELL